MENTIFQFIGIFSSPFDYKNTKRYHYFPYSPYFLQRLCRFLYSRVLEIWCMYLWLSKKSSRASPVINPINNKRTNPPFKNFPLVRPIRIGWSVCETLCLELPPNVFSLRPFVQIQWRISHRVSLPQVVSYPIIYKGENEKSHISFV